MTYATLTDLIERAGNAEIIQIADRDDDNVPDDTVVDAALIHADNIVNSYVGVKYRVPLDETPDIVRTWAVSIARYYLHRYDRPEYLVQDYKDAMSALRDVAAGKISLPTATGVDPAASASSGTVSAVHPRPWFNPRGYRL